MKLLGIEPTRVDLFRGYILSVGEYKRFVSRPNEEAIVERVAKERNYKNYRHFAGVVGKFDPWVVFIKKPVEITSLEFGYLDEVIRSHPVLGKLRK